MPRIRSRLASTRPRVDSGNGALPVAKKRPKTQNEPAAAADATSKEEEVPAAAQGEALKGLEMRVGGNFTGEDAGSPPAERSGCLACLYTCSAGVISNAKANLTLLRRDKGQYRYRLSPKVALADGARVEVIVKN